MTNLFGFSRTQCFSFEFPHILLITIQNGAPDEVLSLWVPCMNVKAPRDTFCFLSLTSKLSETGTCWNDENEGSSGPVLGVVYQRSRRASNTVTAGHNTTHFSGAVVF